MGKRRFRYEALVSFEQRRASGVREVLAQFGICLSEGVSAQGFSR
jgi:hypothetical protein